MLNVLKRFVELEFNLPNCRGQCYRNGAHMKRKKAGLQARFLQINSKALYVSCANHSLNLVVVDSTKSFTEALLLFGVLTHLYVLVFIFHATLNHSKEEQAASTQIAICYCWCCCCCCGYHCSSLGCRHGMKRFPDSCRKSN